MYWDTDLWEISGVSMPYFHELKEVGIFHTTPESAAEKLNSIWDDIPSWWESSSVQNARKNYCSQYASLSPDVFDKLKFNLDKEIKTYVQEISK